MNIIDLLIVAYLAVGIIYASLFFRKHEEEFYKTWLNDKELNFLTYEFISGLLFLLLVVVWLPFEIKIRIEQKNN